MRPPGGYTTDMFNYANDIDIYRAWAELLVKGGDPLAFERRYHCCYASRKYRYRYRHTHDEIMSRYGYVMQEVVQVPGVFSSALGDIGYIFRSPEMEEITTVVEFIHALKNE